MSRLLVHVREARPRDCDEILTINAGALPHVAALDENAVRGLLQQASVALSAADETQVRGYALGFSSLDVYDGEEFRHFAAQVRQPFIYIDQLAVGPDARGQGIALQLYARVQQRGRERGVFTLGAGVNLAPANPVAMRFFRKLGFAPLDELRTADGQHVAILRKDCY